MARNSSVAILGVDVDSVCASDLLDRIDQTIQGGGKAVLQYANVHALNLGCQHQWFREFLNRADIVYADGQGVRLGAWLLGQNLPERIVLTTWVWDIARLCEERGYSVFLLGSTAEVVESAARRAVQRFPKLRIVGTHHGYFAKNGLASDEVVRTIESAAPDVLLVGFGMPLQEQWVRDNMERLRAHVIMTAGSCFDYMAGVKPVCPVWFSNAGFEWLFRLVQEPRRLFARYIIGNPLFVLRVLEQRFSRNHDLGGSSL